MKEIDKYFEHFADFMEAEVAAGREIPDFENVCKIIGAPAAELDAYLADRFGLSGSEIVLSYRTSTPVQFL